MIQADRQSINSITLPYNRMLAISLLRKRSHAEAQVTEAVGKTKDRPKSSQTQLASSRRKNEQIDGSIVSVELFTRDHPHLVSESPTDRKVRQHHLMPGRANQTVANGMQTIYADNKRRWEPVWTDVSVSLSGNNRLPRLAQATVSSNSMRP